MSKIEARFITEPDYNQWDQFVKRSETGTIFHSSKWIRTVAKNTVSDYAIIGVFNDSDLVAGCSFYIKKIFHVFKIGSTKLPLIPYGGFILSLSKSTKVRTSEMKEREIIALILEKIKKLDLVEIELVNCPAFNDIRFLKWQGWSEWVYYTYEMFLDKNIFLSISSNARTNIQKASKYKISIKKEFNPDIYWKLTKKTYNRVNMKIPFEKEYLLNLMEFLIQNNLGEMWIAEMPSGSVAASVFNILDGHNAHAWVGANDPKFKNTGVTSLLEFESIKDLQNRGFHKINMMGANLENIAKFYSEFNLQLVPYYSVKKTQKIGNILNLLR